ncbi:DsbA family protein [Utexia brackfieldae]|uniref:DsbA family protein n=1 Tax=Utexia brackfieldae TaxID=3074108 RepID=UPI00370DDC31
MKKIILLITAMLISFASIAADSSGVPAAKIEEGKQYINLGKPAAPEKEVIEFFSFYCGACFLVETKYHISDAIVKDLPAGAVFKKYHVNSFGGLSKELSEAWAIANVLGINTQVSEALFNGIHKDRNIKTPDDIKKVFANLGVSSEEYDAMKTNFQVQAFLAQQTAAFNLLKPNSVPSFYVNGKYQIDGTHLDQSSEQAIIKDYARVANYLLNLNQ